MLRQVRALEERLGAETEGRAIGLAWCNACDAEEHIAAGAAVDVVIESEEPRMWRLEPRPRLDPDDAGWLYDAGGAVVGKVVRVEGSLVEVADLSEVAPVDRRPRGVRGVSEAGRRAARPARKTPERRAGSERA